MMYLSFGFGALSLLLAIAPQAVESHADKITRCTTTSGVRVFVAHTHSRQEESDILADFLEFTNENSGVTTSINPSGVLWDVTNDPTVGCVPGTSVSVKYCGGIWNDWAYFDIPAVAGETFHYTVDQPTAPDWYFLKNCDKLYPSTILRTIPSEAPSSSPSRFFSDAPSGTPTLPNPVKKPDIYQSESELESAWNMDEPAIDYTTSNNTFHLTYNTTTFFKNFNSDTHLNEEFYDTACKTGDPNTEKVITNGIFGINMYSSQMLQDGGGILHLDFQIDPAILTADSDLYTPYGNGTGALELCVRAAIGFNGTADSNLTLQEQIDGGYREVNFIESLLTVVYDLQNDFAILQLNVEPKDKVTTTFQEDEYGITAWLCNITAPNSAYSQYTYTPTGLTAVTRSWPPAIDDPQFYFNQGALISVCVRPVNDSYAEGIVMDEITNFTWTRSTGPLPVSQKAIEGASAADNLLTYYQSGCTDADYCRFSSILFADFYITRGTASGSGSAKTKFTGTRRRRRLGGDDEGRALQEEGSGSLFDVSVELDITDDGPGALKTAGAVSLGFTTAIVALAGSILFF